MIICAIFHNNLEQYCLNVESLGEEQQHAGFYKDLVLSDMFRWPYTNKLIEMQMKTDDRKQE